MTAAVLTPRGPFSLTAALRFLQGFTPARCPGGSDGVLRLAFPTDDSRFTVTAAVRQDETAAGMPGPVHVDITLHPAGRLHPSGSVRSPAPEPAGAGERAAGQVARVLSLDVDGSRFAAVADADPVVGGLMERFPGLRPVCFNSPYEAAAWAVIGHRVRMSHAAAVKTLLAQRHGHRVEVAGQELYAFPAPAVLHRLTSFPGLTEVKLQRLRAVADAAEAGELDAACLRAAPAQDALAALQKLPGIGPFSAELILIRGAGHPDVFPRHEPRLHAAMKSAYGLDGQAAQLSGLLRITERWKPYRSWAAFLLRADADPRIQAARRDA